MVLAPFYITLFHLRHFKLRLDSWALSDYPLLMSLGLQYFTVRSDTETVFRPFQIYDRISR